MGKNWSELTIVAYTDKYKQESVAALRIIE